jgi:hypothetical protein
VPFARVRSRLQSSQFLLRFMSVSLLVCIMT